MDRYYITLGAPTTAGGKVITANSQDVIAGVAAAYEGDKCSCPVCGSEGVIALDGPRLSETWDGREAALNDDLCICKCSPPPRLVAAQAFAYQRIDSDSHAAQVNAAAGMAARLNATGAGAATTADGIPLVLLDPKTDEPYRNRRYKLELKDKAIEGTTDANGLTQPLTAAERSAVIRWLVADETNAA